MSALAITWGKRPAAQQMTAETKKTHDPTWDRMKVLLYPLISKQQEEKMRITLESAGILFLQGIGKSFADFKKTSSNTRHPRTVGAVELSIQGPSTLAAISIVDILVGTEPKFNLAATKGVGMSVTECNMVIKEAEVIALRVPWTSRGVSLPTQDQPVSRFSAPLHKMMNQALLKPINAMALDIKQNGQPTFGGPLASGYAYALTDAFVVKYSDKDGCQKELKKHTDGTNVHMTVILSLSASEKYTGGGTEFFVSKTAEHPVLRVRPQQGSAVIFPGNDIYHRGVRVTKGTRFILVGFFSKVCKK